ncbi:hypothetical protein HJFPF1_13510 [Paramyrothecium foliicola]|nr:hypothetical protein HJFPF1_13510 [Paramyrothecium foliicola]
MRPVDLFSFHDETEADVDVSHINSEEEFWKIFSGRSGHMGIPNSSYEQEKSNVTFNNKTLAFTNGLRDPSAITWKKAEFNNVKKDVEESH